MKKESKKIIKDELSKLFKGLVIVLVSGFFITLIVKSVGIEKFEFTKRVLGVSVWGFIGILSFVIAWAIIYRDDIRKIAKWLLAQIKER